MENQPVILMETPAVGSTLSAARILLCSGVGLVVVVRMSSECGATIKVRLSDNQGKNFLTLRSGFK